MHLHKVRSDLPHITNVPGLISSGDADFILRIAKNETVVHAVLIQPSFKVWIKRKAGECFGISIDEIRAVIKSHKATGPQDEMVR